MQPRRSAARSVTCIRWAGTAVVGAAINRSYLQRVMSAKDPSMLEPITVVGGIVGLLTGLFTVWDRWARGRPLAWVTATKRFAGTPRHIFASKIQAIATCSSWECVYTRRPHGFTECSKTTRREQYSRRAFTVIRRIKVFGKLIIYWRKTSSTWLPQLPAWVMTSTDDIQRIAAAAVREDDVP